MPYDAGEIIIDIGPALPPSLSQPILYARRRQSVQTPNPERSHVAGCMTGTGSRSPRAARSRVLSGAASRDDRRDGEGGTLRGFANCPLLGSAAQGCQHPPHTACTKHTKHAWPWRGATGRGAMCVTCVAHFGQTANRRRTSDERTGAPQAERPGRPIPRVPKHALGGIGTQMPIGTCKLWSK